MLGLNTDSSIMKKSVVINVQNYSHKFGNNQVINDLSFQVYKGDVFGFLGSNGSGKTTTIRALLGIYRPNSGELTINGQKFNPGSTTTLGYLPEERGLYKKETVLDTMIYFGQLKNMTRLEARRWSLDYLNRVELGDKAGERLDKLSGGQQQKIQLGVTIMNQPDLLILDEPTKGFDPINRRLMLEIIQEHQKQGATIVLVTHQMEEVERFCNRLLLLKDGRRRLYGDINNIRAEYGSSIISLRFKGKLSDNPKLFTTKKKTPTSVALVPEENITTQQILTHLTKQTDLEILKFEVEQMSLDEIFVQIYQKGNGDDDA